MATAFDPDAPVVIDEAIVGHTPGEAATPEPLDSGVAVF